jgi:hypothetical protein
MRKRVVVKFVLVDLAYWHQNPTLAWLVRRIIKTEAPPRVHEQLS